MKERLCLLTQSNHDARMIMDSETKSEATSIRIAVRAFALGALFLFSTASLQASLTPTPSTSDSLHGWEKVGASEGIDIYKKESQGDPIVGLRGEGVVDAPIARVASVILDDHRAKEWVDSLAESKLVKMYSDREFLEYSHIGTSFLLTDRDFLTRGVVDSDLKEKTITMRLRSVDDPVKPVGQYVRGELEGYWKMKSVDNGTRTYVIAEMHADPKGSIPKWIVNLFQKGWAKGTLESLRKQVAKSDIQIIPAVTRLFPVAAVGSGKGGGATLGAYQ